MNERDERHDTGDEPRWLKLAADVRGEPDGSTLARVRARLAARRREPAWVRWLSRPAALATSVGLLIACAWAGDAWLRTATSADETSIVSAMLAEDGSFGLVGTDDAAGLTSPDSGEVAP